MNELTIGDKIYVSSKRAAEITGYAKDYVGQLCREGHVEAKMVGRSWYVLESSIREHRFGKQEEERRLEPVTESLNVPDISLPATWEPSVYTSETVSAIPKITPAPRATEPVSYETPTEEPALSEMQHAWKEWFETRRSSPSQRPEAVEEQNEEETRSEEEIPLSVHRTAEPYTEEREIVLDIKRVARPIEDVSEPIYSHPEPIVRERKVRRSSAGVNVIVVAVLVVLAGISIAVAAISTGYAANYLNDNPVIRFIGGTTTISK